MAEAAPDYRQHEEFWRPLPGPRLQNEAAAELVRPHCAHCRADLVLGAKYCHSCGIEQPVGPVKPRSLRIPLDGSLATALGQTVGSLIALILGCFCILAAGLIGYLFKVNTLSDWQAIQLWRIEWLLAAIALFIVGMILKRPADKP